jgi:hypothetical protein
MFAVVAKAGDMDRSTSWSGNPQVRFVRKCGYAIRTANERDCDLDRRCPCLKNILFVVREGEPPGASTSGAVFQKNRQPIIKYKKRRFVSERRDITGSRDKMQRRTFVKFLFLYRHPAFAQTGVATTLCFNAPA